MLQVVAEICGLHAQLTSSAELALWARVDGLEPEAVQRALWEERDLVKSWAMRGTLHLLPAAEFPLWQAALSSYRHYLRPVWLRGFGVTREELERLVAAVAEALEGRMLTREELAEEVSRLTGSASLGEKLRESWGAYLKPVAFRGHLCFAPNLGQNVRFTRPDWWLGGWRPVDSALATQEIARRYLGAYGPATAEDFGRWWGATPPQARNLIESLGEEVIPVEVEGIRARMLSAHAAEAADSAPAGTVRLLPAFDQYVIGASRDPSGILAEIFRDRVYRPQGWVSPVLLVDGRMEGVWRHERKGSRLEVRIEPFETLPGWARRAAEQEAERLARFVGAALEVTWG